MANFIGVGAVQGTSSYTGAEPAAGTSFHGPIRTDQAHVVHYGNAGLRALAFDADSATTLSLGTTNATQVNIGGSGVRTDLGGYLTINSSPANQDGINVNKGGGISSASDVHGIELWGATNTGGGVSIGVRCDGGWNYGGKFSSHVWLTDDTRTYYGTSLDSSIIWQDAISTMAMIATGQIGINPSSNLLLTSTSASVDINASTTCTIDAGASGISLDSSGTSNFSTSGGNLTLEATGSGSDVIITANDLVDVNAGTGGFDVDCTGIFDIASSSTGDSYIQCTGASSDLFIQNTASSGWVYVQANNTSGRVRMYASGSSGTIEIASGTGGVFIDAVGAGVSIDGQASSNFSTSSGTMTISSPSTLTLTSTGGATVVTSNASYLWLNAIGVGNYVYLTSNNSYVDINAGTSVSIDAAAGNITLTTQTSYDIVLNALGTGGQVDINAGTGGVTIDAGGASNFTTSSGSLTLTGASTLVLNGNTNVDMNAGYINIDTTAGGIGISTNSSGNISLTTGGAYDIVLTATGTGGQVDINGGTGGITLDCSGTSNFTTTSGNLTLSATGAGGDVILTANDVVQTNCGTLDLNGTTVDIDATGSFYLTGVGSCYVETSAAGAPNLYIQSLGTNAWTYVTANNSSGRVYVQATNATGAVELAGGEVYCRRTASVTNVTQRLIFATLGSTTGLQLIFGPSAPNASGPAGVASGSLFSQTGSPYGLWQMQNTTWVKIA